MPVDYWDKVLGVNLRGPLLCTRAVAPLMRANGWGRVVNISSMGAYMVAGVYGVQQARPQPAHVRAGEPSSAATGSPSTRSHPGTIANEASRRQVPDAGFEKLVAASLIKRTGDGRGHVRHDPLPDGDDAGWVTGQTFLVNGGFNTPAVSEAPDDADDQTMTGGEAIVAALEALGVRHVFGIVSVHNLPIVDAIARSSAVTMVEMRHEQGAVHAADGYARATGGLGVALASTGPGTANAMGGLFEAQFASSRVLLLTGQVETSVVRQGAGDAARGRAPGRHAAHGLPVRRPRPATTPRSSPTVLDAARDITSGRPQPGAVEVPIDLQYATGEVRVGDPRPPVVQAPAAAAVERAAELLARRHPPAAVGRRRGGLGRRVGRADARSPSDSARRC